VTREVSLEQSLAQSSVRLEQMLAARDATPSHIVEQQEDQLKLAEVLERLPDDYRQAIVLRNLCDLPHAEVARRMQRSEGAVRMLWMRALAQLKQELEEND
jgi:RNA polymerase sigma-70 factor (ECF subfamily)